MSELSTLSRFVRPIVNRIKNMIGKCILTVIYDNNHIQLIKVDGFESETLDGVERLQDYGFSSVPPVNKSEVLLLAIGGNRDHCVAVKADCGRYRPKGNDEGVVTMYDMFDNLIKMSEGKTQHTSESIELNGNSKFFVTHAELDAALQSFVTALNLHVHTCAAAGSPSTTPIAVTPTPLQVPGTFVLNISSAKTTTIKTGG